MSTCVALKNKSYIVFASDSRSCILNQNAVVSFTDAFEKIVFLPQSGIALAMTGVNIIDETPICDFVRNLDSSLSGLQLSEAAECIAKAILPYIPEKQYVNACIARGCEGFFVDIGVSISVLLRPLETCWSAGQTDVLYKLYISERDGQNIIIPNIQRMSLSQLTRFAEHLVRTQIEYTEFSGKNAYVGGPVQILALDKNGMIPEFSRLPR